MDRPAIFFCLTLMLQLASSDVYDQGALIDDVSVFLISDDDYEGLTNHIEVFAPKSEGQFPVILFSSAFGGVFPCGLYSEMVGHIVSYGYVMICQQALNFVEEFDGYGLTEIVEWSEENLEQILISEEGFPTGFEIDFNTLYLMGHSAGAHVTGGYLQHDCSEKTKGWIMLSPVDTALDPLIPNEEGFPFSLPSIVMPAGLDSSPGALGFRCTKEHWSNRRFYNAMSGDAWMLNATEYGHADVLNPLLVEINQEIQLCATGTDLTQYDYNDYLRYTAGSIVAFIQGIEGNCDMLNYLEDTSLMIVDVLAEKKGMGLKTCGQGGCSFL